eukprot:364865-Chlamydomonas_euryale.AAC.7
MLSALEAVYGEGGKGYTACATRSSSTPASRVVGPVVPPLNDCKMQERGEKNELAGLAIAFRAELALPEPGA